MTGPRLRFWGVRGSVPAPGPTTARYGGNTPCVTVEGDPRHLIVLDAGTGIRELGRHLVADTARPAITLLLSHTHWDHIQGLPFFRPLYQASWQIEILGPPHPETGLGRVLEHLTLWEHFPIPSSSFLGLRGVRELSGRSTQVGSWTVGWYGMCHAGPTLGFRLDGERGRSVAYLPDNELAGNRHGVGAGWRAGLVDFLRGVHTLVHDTTNDDDERTARAGWGHSSVGEAVELAREANCRRLVLFHHDPERDDTAMDRLWLQAREAAGPRLEVVAAMEGTDLMLDPTA
jgi:phosphoribosyl 1,2-cyclic phosphodiesterase